MNRVLVKGDKLHVIVFVVVSCVFCPILLRVNQICHDGLLFINCDNCLGAHRKLNGETFAVLVQIGLSLLMHLAQRLCVSE